MRRLTTWSVVAAGAVTGAAASLVANFGLALWQALLSIGIVTSPPCTDNFSSSALGLCARPSSLVITTVVATALAALLGGLAALLILHQVRLRRLSCTSYAGTGTDVRPPWGGPSMGLPRRFQFLSLSR